MLLDLRPPEGGVEATTRIVGICPTVRFIMLAAFEMSRMSSRRCGQVQLLKIFAGRTAPPGE
jgi:hypothetical protein